MELQQQEGHTSENERLQTESTQALQAQRVQEKEERNVTDTSGFKFFFFSAQVQRPILREADLT